MRTNSHEPQATEGDLFNGILRLPYQCYDYSKIPPFCQGFAMTLPAHEKSRGHFGTPAFGF